MKLTFLKVNVQQTEGEFAIDIAPGALQFSYKGADVALAEPLQLEMTHTGQFANILRYVDFKVFIGQDLDSKIMQASVFALVTHKDFDQALYKAMRACKVVPMFRLIDERELFASEYGQAFKKMMGVDASTTK